MCESLALKTPWNSTRGTLAPALLPLIQAFTNSLAAFAAELNDSE